MINPEQFDPTWEKCARLLLLNPLQKLLIFQTTVDTIFDNIITYQNDDKYTTLKTSNSLVRCKILEVTGGLEFLMGIGFLSKVDQFDNKVLKFCIERVDDYDTKVRRILGIGRKWLAETISTCESIVNNVESPKVADSCAECIVNIKLPTGISVHGGFLKQDKLLDVLSFACCYFDRERVGSVALISPATRQRLTLGELNSTLAEFGMHPRAALLATVLSQEDTSALLSKVVNDVKVQKVNARNQVKKERMYFSTDSDLSYDIFIAITANFNCRNQKALRQALLDERNKTLQNFKDDRLDFH